MQLHHVGVVVSDLEVALEHYRRLGFASGERFDLPHQSIVAVTLEAGSGFVELITPTDPEGPISRYLEKRGDTVHHVAYRVDDIEKSLQALAASGVRLIDSTPRPGAHGWRVAFIHPESCSGVLTELVEVIESDRV